MMVYPEEPSWAAVPHIPALYEDGDYGGMKLSIKKIVTSSINRFLRFGKLIKYIPTQTLKNITLFCVD